MEVLGSGEYDGLGSFGLCADRFVALRWRRFNQANDNSGMIGATIVGVFVAIVIAYYAGLWVKGKHFRTRSLVSTADQVTTPAPAIEP